MQTEIILATASEIRRTLLANAGVAFTSKVARIDEETIKASLIAEDATPRDIADALAEMKALRVSANAAGAVVIGCDQVLEFQNTLLSKPSSRDEARQQLQAMRGKTHNLLSAAVIVKNGQPQWRHVGNTRLTMRDFSDTFIDGYLDRMGDEIYQTVGAYKLEAEGVRLFSKIEGDYFNVLGLPLLEMLAYLTQTGLLEK